MRLFGFPWHRCPAAVAADKALFTTMAVLGAAVSGMDAAHEGFQVKSLQEYALDRKAAL